MCVWPTIFYGRWTTSEFVCECADRLSFYSVCTHGCAGDTRCGIFFFFFSSNKAKSNWNGSTRLSWRISPVDSDLLLSIIGAIHNNAYIPCYVTIHRDIFAMYVCGSIQWFGLFKGIGRLVLEVFDISGSFRQWRHFSTAAYAIWTASACTSTSLSINEGEIRKKSYTLESHQTGGQFQLIESE